MKTKDLRDVSLRCCGSFCSFIIPHVKSRASTRPSEPASPWCCCCFCSSVPLTLMAQNQPPWLMQPLPGAKAPGLFPLATPSSKNFWIWTFQTECEFPGSHGQALCREGGTGTRPALRHGGTSSPPAFTGTMEMPERTRAEQILKQQCFVPCSRGAMAWDEPFARPGSLEAKPTAPLPGSLTRWLQSAYLTGRRKGRTVFAR